MSKAAPWFQFFSSDWLASTRTIKPAEAGILISLMAMMHERGEPLPEDIVQLARGCNTTPATLKKVLEILIRGGHIELMDGALRNAHIEVQLKNATEKSENAKNSAQVRHQKSKEKQGKAYANAMLYQNQISDSERDALNERHASDRSELSGHRSTLDDVGSAPGGASLTFSIDDDYTIPSVGIGWISEIRASNPWVLVVCVRDDDGHETRYLVHHPLRGAAKFMETGSADDQREADDDAA